MVVLRLPPDIEQRLIALAKKTGKTKPYYAREAILRHIEDMEDAYTALDRLVMPGKRWLLDDLERGRDLKKLDGSCPQWRRGSMGR